MRLRLAINNCFAVKRWPLADEWAQIVAGELGLDSVQHSLDLVDLGAGESEQEAQAEEVRNACARAGLVVHSVFTGLAAYSSNMMLAPAPDARRRAAGYWAAAIRFAARLEATSVGGHLGSLSRADADNPERRAALWDELDEHLESLRRLAGERGVAALLVENMACEREPSTMGEMRSLMREREGRRAAVRLCLDVGHQCVPGSSGEERDPYAWLRALGSCAAVVHLQQSAADGDGHWPFTPQRNRLGRIEAPRVLEALAASGAENVALILEVIPAFEADDRIVLAELAESVDYWRAALADFDHTRRAVS